MSRKENPVPITTGYEPPVPNFMFREQLFVEFVTPVSREDSLEVGDNGNRYRGKVVDTYDPLT